MFVWTLKNDESHEIGALEFIEITVFCQFYSGLIYNENKYAHQNKII